jgi:hypothetical protein
MNEKTNEQAWDYATGISKVDGGKPSELLLSLIEKNKNGEIDDDDIQKALIKEYKKA